MTSFIRSAKYMHDVDSDISYVEITYEKYGHATYSDSINTEPLANWTHLQSRGMSIPYDKFLDTMVSKTPEVKHRMAELIVDTIFAYEQENDVYVRVAHAAKILDPTFQPPYVNTESAWQMNVVKTFCKEHMTHAIRACTNMSRLDYFIRVLRIIELGEASRTSKYSRETIHRPRPFPFVPQL